MTVSITLADRKMLISNDNGTVDGKEKGTRGNKLETFMHHAGDHIGAAGGGAAAHDQAQAGSQHHAAVQGPQQRIMCHGLQGQDVNEQREKQRGDNAPEGENPAHCPETDQEQRNIQDQCHITDAEMEYILDHGVDAAKAGWGELIRENENIVVHGHQNCGCSNHGILGCRIFQSAHIMHAVSSFHSGCFSSYCTSFVF